MHGGGDEEELGETGDVLLGTEPYLKRRRGGESGCDCDGMALHEFQRGIEWKMGHGPSTGLESIEAQGG